MWSHMLELLAYIAQPGWIISIICLLLLIYNWWSHPHRRFPPGVRGLPLLGALPFFGKYPERTIQRWSREKYGPVMSVRMGRKDVIVINDYENLYEAFVRKASVYADRPHIPVVNDGFLEGDGLTFRIYDSELKNQRKFALSKHRQLGLGNVVLEEKINEVVDQLMHFISLQNENPFNPSHRIGETIASIICSIIFGNIHEHDKKDFKKLVQTIFNMYGDPNYSEYIGILLLYPGIKSFPPFNKAYAAYRRNGQFLMDYAAKMVDAHKLDFRERDVRDYIDAFLKEMELRNGGGGFYERQLIFSLLDFLVAGTETSSYTILWGLLCAVCHPECQKKLHEELDSVIGKQNRVRLDMRDQMPYTMAFIQEVTRFRTLTPLGLQRMTSQDTELAGYHIPKHTTVIPNIWAIHNDPQLWENPENFEPERHLADDGSFVYSNKLIPFGIGARSCIGEKLARMELFLVFANLLSRFEFLPDPQANEPPNIKDGLNSLVFSPFPFKCVAKERNVSNSE